MNVIYLHYCFKNTNSSFIHIIMFCSTSLKYGDLLGNARVVIHNWSFLYFSLGNHMRAKNSILLINPYFLAIMLKFNHFLSASSNNNFYCCIYFFYHHVRCFKEEIKLLWTLWRRFKDQDHKTDLYGFLFSKKNMLSNTTIH